MHQNLLINVNPVTINSKVYLYQENRKSKFHTKTTLSISKLDSLLIDKVVLVDRDGTDREFRDPTSNLSRSHTVRFQPNQLYKVSTI